MKRITKTQKSSSGGLVRLLKYSQKSSKLFALAIILMIFKMAIIILFVTLLANILGKLYFSYTLNQFLQTHQFQLIVLIIIPFILPLFTYLIKKTTFKASSTIRKTLRKEIFGKLMELEFGYIENKSTASMINNLVDGIEALDVFYEDFLPQLYYAIIMPLVLFFVFLQINLKVALILLLGFPLIPVSIMFVQIKAKPLMSRYWENYSDVGGQFLDNLQGLTTLNVLGIDAQKSDELSKEFWRFRNTTMDVLKMQLKSILFMDSIAYGLAGVAIVVGIMDINNVSQFEVTHIANMIIIILLAIEFFLPLRQLGSSFHAGINGISASHEIFSILDSNPTLKTPEKPIIPENFLQNNITFKNVNFTYPHSEEQENSRNSVINNLSFQIKKGTTVALIGDSGSGKSTIANLIARFYDVDDGQIMIDKNNISSYDLYYLRSQISYVGANTYIFSGTITDNLRIVNHDLSQKEMIDACVMAGLGDFIKEKGLDYDVGEWGKRLSGGEKQRLGIARAILNRPSIYIFDEATSNIDIESEERIWNSIEKLTKNHTCLIITHRLHNIKHVDNILVLSNGSIIEQGGHTNLYEQNGYYKRGVEEQSHYEN